MSCQVGPTPVHTYTPGGSFGELALLYNSPRAAMPAPYVPVIKSATDDSNFDQYTDEGKEMYPEEDFPKATFAEFADDWV